MMNVLKKLLLSSLLLTSTSLALAQDITVNNAWVRFSVKGMTASGAFLDIANNSDSSDTLVAVSSPIAEYSEIHESFNKDGMMSMRPLTHGLPLPAKQVTHLQPGGAHIMFMNLKQPLQAGTSIPIKLLFKHHAPVSLTVPVITGPKQQEPMQQHQHHVH